ncbi:hypothetical protein CDAR_381371 [Caerostris darwini]|uniref:Uncharacterized protein n=1 Tax=Caerostris darwini TaxID=1538125 RepID=A0AAV4PKY5_9ARAC|nr:hypothetical protein CDAR_381371 [Caerostris darwini]
MHYRTANCVQSAFENQSISFAVKTFDIRDNPARPFVARRLLCNRERMCYSCILAISFQCSSPNLLEYRTIGDVKFFKGKEEGLRPSNYNPSGPPGETHQWRSHYFSPGEETTEVGNKFTDRAVASVTFTDNSVHSFPDAIALSTGSDVGAPRCVLQAHKKKTGFECCH